MRVTCYDNSTALFGNRSLFFLIALQLTFCLTHFENSEGESAKQGSVEQEKANGEITWRLCVTAALLSAPAQTQHIVSLLEYALPQSHPLSSVVGFFTPSHYLPLCFTSQPLFFHPLHLTFFAPPTSFPLCPTVICTMLSEEKLLRIRFLLKSAFTYVSKRFH